MANDRPDTPTPEDEGGRLATLPEDAGTETPQQYEFESLWRVRLRLAWRGFKRGWGLFSENKVGIVGLVVIFIFGLMAIGLIVNIAVYPLVAAVSYWGFRVRRLLPGEHAAEARLV